MTSYLDDTQPVPLGPHRYCIDVNERWWIVAGPNGGYLAAACIRAMQRELPDRRLGSVSLQYLRAPVAGTAELEVETIRAGRSVATVRVVLRQGGRDMVIATASMLTPRAASEYDDLPRRSLPTPDEVVDVGLHEGEGRPEGDFVVPMRTQFEYRPVISRPFRAGDPATPARAGGWLRFSTPVPTDAAVLAAYTDAWWPPVFHRLPGEAFAVPTIDLTMHVLRVPEGPHAWVFGEYEAPVAVGGYLIEDARLFDIEGRLLATSRQLAMLL